MRRQDPAHYAGARKLPMKYSIIAEAIAAKVEDVPCVNYLGRSRPFAKMIQCIEYGIMKVISETLI